MHYIGRTKDELLKELSELKQRNLELELMLNKEYRCEIELYKSRAQLESELSKTKLLQSLSTQMLYEGNIHALYQRIIEIAMVIMRSDYASMQILIDEPGMGRKLKLIAFHGFDPQAVLKWQWVDAATDTTSCAEALRKGYRIIVPDVKECDFMMGSEDLNYYLNAGIRSVQSTPLYSRSGRLLGMISTHWSMPHTPMEYELSYLDLLARQAADLIEYKLGQELLRESEEKYRTLFEHMNEGFFLGEVICDADGKVDDFRFIATNAAFDKYINIHNKDIIGKLGSQVLPDITPYKEVIERVALQGEPIIIDFYSPISNRILHNRLFCPRPRQFASIIQDITEQRQWEEKMFNQQKKLLEIEMEKNGALKKAIQAKDEFLNIVTHEFKTPLTVINAALQTIDRLYSKQLPENVLKHLERIRTNTYRQLRLVNNLLDVTRYHADGLKLNRRNLDIVSLTKAIVRSVEVYARQKGITIYYSSNIKKKEIALDEEKYERVLLNLLSNAIKFTPKGNSIFVDLFCDKQEVIIKLKDEGVGIPKSKLNLIFERFGQVDRSLTRQAEGTGIGLSLVKTLVEGMNGTISVDSEVGKGSLFTITIPAIKSSGLIALDNHVHPQASRIVNSTAIEFSDIFMA